MEKEAQIVEWINELGFTDGKDRATLIKKIQELLIFHCPSLLSEYLENVLSYATDKNQEVKKAIITLIEEVCKVDASLFPGMVTHLHMLLGDQVVAVQKRLIQAANIIYRSALQWVSNTNTITPQVEVAWNTLNDLKLQILNMVDSENEGIRTNSIRFLGGIVILQTYTDENVPRKPEDFSLDDVPPNSKLVNRKTLEDEANHIFDLLVKFHNSEHISGMNLMACMTALCDVGKSRPMFLKKVIPALEELHTTLPPTLTQSQVNSVRKHLKMQLINVIRNTSANELLPMLAKVLSDLGMTQPEITKVIPKEKRNKRILEFKSVNMAKKMKLDQNKKQPRRVDSPHNQGRNIDAPQSSVPARRNDSPPINIPLRRMDSPPTNIQMRRIDSPQGNSLGSGSDSLSQDATTEDFLSSPAPVPPPTVSVATEQSLLEGLNSINNVINLVVDTMKHLPDDMPSEFAKLYEPISKSTTILPKPALSKLLLTIIKDESEPTSAPVETKQDENKINLKNALAKLQTKKQIDSAVSKLMEETRNETKALEAARERELAQRPDEPKPPVVETPTVPKLKQRVKTIKLLEVTKPIPKDVRERILMDAIKRILNAERASRDGKVAHIREKMLITFAVSYGPVVRETILTFILNDVGSRMELALSWLYEEFSHVQEYNRSNTSVGKFSDKSGINYNNLLCSLITNIAEIVDPSQEVLREILFRRIYLESPLITDDALSYLTHVCREEGKTIMGLNLLKDLIALQPPKASKLITAMLPLAINENQVIRNEAVSRIVEIYKTPNESVRRVVNKHANLYLGFIALLDPPKDLCHFDTMQITSQGWTDELYKICLQLFIALLPYNEDSLTNLCRAYAGAGVEGKRCVLRLLDGPINEMGAEHPVLLAFIEECPKGAETLVTKIIHLLTEKAPPTKHLVDKVRNLYEERVSDVRFLIPVITGLSKREIFDALPKLIKLNPVVVKEVFSKLLGTQSDVHQSLPVTPAELLIGLHFIDQSKAELKYVVRATSLCFAEKETYTAEVLEEVLQRLSEQSQLPVLLMRSVLQALTLHPTKLASLVINILKTLIVKQVWEHKVVWEGFLKCCQRLKPQSCMVLIELPPDPLRMALEACQDLTLAMDKVLHTISNVLPHVTLITKTCMINAGFNVSTDSYMDTADMNEPLPPGMS